MINNNNPLLCDPAEGVCEIANSYNGDQIVNEKTIEKPIKIIYFTDPICSSCWGIEPQLRKLKLEYGEYLQIDYRMGGLLPDWSYNSGGISKPSDVAHHWDEVSKYYDMPIDGDIWLENPLDSSYPPSIAFKAAQLQDENKALKFLRRIREMVFIEKKNITEWSHLRDAAHDTGLDSNKLKMDYESRAKKLFNEDLQLAAKLGVRGFPTLLFKNMENKEQIVYGFKPYHAFEQAIVNLLPGATKKYYSKLWINIFDYFPTLTTREFSELTGNTKSVSENQLHQLASENELIMKMTKNGPLWIRSHSNNKQLLSSK